MISLSDIRKSFDRLEVLRGVSLDVEAGEVMSIVGPSGAGKTTLLHIMGTLDRPDSGKVSYDGRDLSGLSSNELARFRNSSVGFVFQFHQLLPEFSMIENVAMPALIGGMRRKEAFARASELIDYLGLAERAAHRPSQLSGGERQRAAVHGRWSTALRWCLPTSRQEASTATTARNFTVCFSNCGAIWGRHS